MKKSVTLFLLALSFVAVASVSAEFVTGHGAPFYTTVPEGQAAATKAGIPLVVKFYTDW